MIKDDIKLSDIVDFKLIETINQQLDINTVNNNLNINSKVFIRIKLITKNDKYISLQTTFCVNISITILDYEKYGLMEENFFNLYSNNISYSNIFKTISNNLGNKSFYDIVNINSFKYKYENLFDFGEYIIEALASEGLDYCIEENKTILEDIVKNINCVNVNMNLENIIQNLNVDDYQIYFSSVKPIDCEKNENDIKIKYESSIGINCKIDDEGKYIKIKIGSLKADIIFLSYKNYDLDDYHWDFFASDRLPFVRSDILDMIFTDIMKLENIQYNNVEVSFKI